MKKLIITLGIIFSALTANAKPIVIDGSTTVGPLAKAFAEFAKTNYGLEVTVGESGSGNGVKSLINGTCDIATMSREIKENEIASAKTKNVIPFENVVALDGLTIIVHPSNPIKNISKEQIKNIYSGKIKNWKDVGGVNSPIVVIQRESNSGTQGSFKELVMGEDKIAQGVETQSSNGSIKSRVATTKNSISFVGHSFVDKSVKAVLVDGIIPTSTNIKSGKYPIHRKLYMYTNGAPLGDLKKFIDIKNTAKGKKLIEELGFVNY